MQRKKFYVMALVGVLAFSLTGCGRKLSGRDARREQIRANADIKRSELTQIAGSYYGLLKEDGGIEQQITLSIEIKDVATTEDGQIDPILVPTIAGYFRFTYGADNPNAAEHFQIAKADYDAKNKFLSMTVSNEKYKDILLDLFLKDRKLTGRFSAPHLQYNGEIELSRDKPDNGNANPQSGLNGEYSGILQWDDRSQYQHVTFRFQSIFQHPEGLKISGSAKIYFGEKGSAEYLLYNYEHIDINPLSQDITIRDPNAAASFVGRYTDGKIVGNWFSTFTGKIGKISARKGDSVDPPEGFVRLGMLRGTYLGTTTNSGNQLQLPERTMVSLVSNEDQTAPGAMRVSGSIRFYIGDFGGIEYEELPFTNVQVNHFTRTFNATTEGKYVLEIRGTIENGKITGKISSESLGELADLEVVQ